MKLKFKTNAQVSEVEGKYYGGTDFKKGETYEMTGDQAKHWLYRHLADIVEELSDENLKHARKYSKEILNYLIDNKIENLAISAPLPKITVGKGKFGVNELMTHIGIANNHLHSSYHLMANSAKGYLDRVFKFQKILPAFNHSDYIKIKFTFVVRAFFIITPFGFS